MSKESYARGFCKAAAAHGVDPKALAEMVCVQNGQQAMTKKAFSWADVQKYLEKAKSMAGKGITDTKLALKDLKSKLENLNLDPKQKVLVGTGLGALTGGVAGAVGGKLTGIGAGKGMLAGIGLGGLGGGAYGAHRGGLINLRKLVDAIKKENKNSESSSKTTKEQDATDKANDAASQNAVIKLMEDWERTKNQGLPPQ